MALLSVLLNTSTVIALLHTHTHTHTLDIPGLVRSMFLSLPDHVTISLLWLPSGCRGDACYLLVSDLGKNLSLQTLGAECFLAKLVYRALCVLERALPTEAAQLAGPNHSHTEQDRALCVLERALPTELLRQLSWLGRITHTQSKTEHSVF